MVDVVQKSVLVPSDKYKRLMSLQETHRANFEADSESVVAVNVHEKNNSPTTPGKITKH